MSESDVFAQYTFDKTKNGYHDTVDDFIDFVFPNLHTGEHIVLLNKGYKSADTMSFASKERFKGFMSSYNAKRNGKEELFLSLSTCVEVDGVVSRKSRNMHRRFCLGFDYDDKDFGFDSADECSEHFKNTIGIYHHFLVDTGHGYHIYVGIEETTDIKRVADITRRYAIISGADRGNVSTAQTLRMPGTVNFKYPQEPMSVNIVYGYHNNALFRRYSLDYLDNRHCQIERDTGIRNREKLRRVIALRSNNEYKCVLNMIARGVEKGKRNKCLGRIVSYYRDVAKISREQAFYNVLEWNRKCSEHCKESDWKSDAEVTADFNRYWDNKYNLLGCISDNNPINDILAEYCDKANCKRIRVFESSVPTFVLDANYATNKCLQTLNGYAYLILKVLNESKAAYRVSEIASMINQSIKKTDRALKSLLQLKLIRKLDGRPAKYVCKNLKDSDHKITLPQELFKMLADGWITEHELVTYIAIRRNAYQGTKCTYEALGKALGKSKISVWRTVKNKMVSNGLLEIEPMKTGRLMIGPGYKFEAKANYYYFPLEIADEGD